MMSMGVPGIVAVASNMCDKFPKALAGAYKRARFDQVDVKLGLIMGASGEVGVLVGVQLQENIKAAFGDAGSNFYISVAFVGALSIVGTYVLWDAWKIFRSGNMNAVEKTSRLALWVRTIRIPHTMVYLPSIKAEMSLPHHDSARLRHRHARRSYRRGRIYRRSVDDLCARCAQPHVVPPPSS